MGSEMCIRDRTVTPRAGMNQLLAIVRLPVAGDARTTSLSYEYLLGFSAH